MNCWPSRVLGKSLQLTCGVLGQLNVSNTDYLCQRVIGGSLIVYTTWVSDTPVISRLPRTLDDHEWSYTKSSIKHQPQQNKELYALKIPDQRSCRGSLSSFYAPGPDLIYMASHLIYHIYSLEINFLICTPE